MPEAQPPPGPISCDRPDIPAGYGVPKSKKGLLPWSWAQERLQQAQIYWVMTVRPDGRPHAIPTWGSWVDDRFYFGASAETRHGRNVATNPAVGIHLESGAEVVIVEGMAEEIVADWIFGMRGALEECGQPPVTARAALLDVPHS